MKVSEKDIEELTGITRYTQNEARKVRLSLQDYSEHIYKLRETTVRMLYRLTNRQILACHPKELKTNYPPLTQEQEQELAELGVYLPEMEQSEEEETIIVRKKGKGPVHQQSHKEVCYS